MNTTLPQHIFCNKFSNLDWKGSIMSGVVIAFPGSTANAHCAHKARKALRGSRKQSSQIKARVERIGLLLAELDNLLPLSSDLSAVLTHALATVSQVEERLGSTSPSHPAAGGNVEEERDSQPHVDREVLERHFQSLDG